MEKYNLNILTKTQNHLRFRNVLSFTSFIYLILSAVLHLCTQIKKIFDLYIFK